jgi:imidazoleglycerol phosphate dehydratase HisB
MKYCSCEKISLGKYHRKTKEVDITCEISEDGKSLVIYGRGDLRHHLVEDAAILAKLVAEKECGHSV